MVSSTGQGEDARAPVSLTRRALLAGSASALAAGASMPAAAQQSGGAQVPDFDDWFGPGARGGETSSFTAVDDRRGADAVTIDVGAGGNGGTYAFGPTAVWVDPGTTITFEWVSNTHDVTVEEQPEGADWSGHETTEDAGFTFEYTFETAGIYTYFCQPHLGFGMKGGIAVGDDVPLTSPPSTGGGFTLPGGDDGAAFMGVLLGTVGLAAAIVLAGEVHGSVTPDGEGPRSAHATALAVATVGLALLVAVVARLILG